MMGQWLEIRVANKFKRKLPDGALEHLKKECAWWQDVLSFRYVEKATGSPRSLLFALRDGYFNLYAEGQSVLKVEFDARRNGDLRVRCKLHRKYVSGSDAGDGYFDFDGMEVTEGREKRPVQKYAGLETLAGWVEATRAYAGDEKKGVAVIANQHPEVIDVEMALPANDVVTPGDKKVANRMDSSPWSGTAQTFGWPSTRPSCSRTANSARRHSRAF